MKKLLLIIAVTVSAMLPVTAFAASKNDAYYSGVLDVTYEDSNGSLDGDNESSTRKAITGDVSYDTSSGFYYFYASDVNSPFSASVCNGMITKDSVTLNIPNGIVATLYRNGEEVSGDITKITRVGKYVLQYRNNLGGAENLLEFIIVGDNTGIINDFTPPDGFYVFSVTLDETPLTPYSTVSLTEEGKYVIKYRCDKIDKEYTLNMNIDHTPPTLALSNVVDGKVWGPVDVSDLEDGATLTVIRDGEIEDYSDGVLSKSGNYKLIVTDSASNSTEYEFTIMIYFNSGSWFFVIAVLTVIAAVIAYILYSKKTLRVR